MQVKPLLDRVRAACKGKPEPIKSAYKAFNRVTKDGKEMGFYSNLLDQSISSMIEVKESSDIDSLFGSKTTSALKNEISGLDDFELINFIVVQG